MAGFFRKVASAFVELPEEPRREPEPAPSTDDVTELLAQIDASRAAKAAEPPPEPTPPAPEPATDLLHFDADAVYAASGVEDTPNSAGRLLKMIAGLAMFPADQQLAMVRALDAADASWTEGGVLADARKRQQILRAHQDKVEREHARRVAAIGEQGREAQMKGNGVVAEIDQQIAELQRLRQEALGETASTLARLDGERREADAALTNVRTTIAEAQAKLSGLINFFAGQGAHGG